MAEGFALTEAGAMAMRVTHLEQILRHFDRTSMDLHLYCRAVEGMPTAEQWQLILDQIHGMVDADGPRNPSR